jgi:hypothetical protein
MPNEDNTGGQGELGRVGFSPWFDHVNRIGNAADRSALSDKATPLGHPKGT